MPPTAFFDQRFCPEPVLIIEINFPRGIGRLPRMSIRRHTLLVFFLCGWLPAVGLACAVFGFGEYTRKIQFEERTRDESKQIALRLHAALITRERQLEQLAQDLRVHDTLSSSGVPHKDIRTGSDMPFMFGPPVADYWSVNGGDLRAVYGFDAKRQPVFIGEIVPGPEGGFVTKLTTSIPQVTLDQAIWSRVEKGAPFGMIVQDGVARHYLPIKDSTGWVLLIADFSLDGLLREALKSDQPTSDAEYHLVLDQRGNLVNEISRAIRYQPIASTFPGFANLDAPWATGPTGSKTVFDRGVPYFLAYQPVDSLGLSVAVMRRRDSVGGKTWWGFLAALIGITLLFLAFVRWHQTARRRERQTIEQLARQAAEVAAGKLTQPVTIDPPEDLQTLTDNFNRMIEKVREQIAREAEARQFQSFMRLSATITHDLKNAIQVLSLLVGNLEANFDDPKFRAHAINGLTNSTETLNALIARLSGPMRSMSGELPLPHPTDLVRMLRQVLQVTAEQHRGRHELKIDLPEKLIAEVDAERVEKVFENLIINALQAMDKKPGVLTVSAIAGAENCTISITDTGVGMTEDYIKEKLFRPFNTTKPLGIGLGLYTCREVIQAHLGTIEADSEKGSGTTFRVVLPLRAQAFRAT